MLSPELSVVQIEQSFVRTTFVVSFFGCCLCVYALPFFVGRNRECIRFFFCVVLLCVLLMFVVDDTVILHVVWYRIILADIYRMLYIDVQVVLVIVALLSLLWREQVRLGINGTLE